MNILKGSVPEIRHNRVTVLFEKWHFSPSESGLGLSRCTLKTLRSTEHQTTVMPLPKALLAAGYAPDSNTEIDSLSKHLVSGAQEHAMPAGGGLHWTAQPREYLHDVLSQGVLLSPGGSEGQGRTHLVGRSSPSSSNTVCVCVCAFVCAWGEGGGRGKLAGLNGCL